ncbi:hypothetical protein MRX96_016244 [Rhipicephalus microplus]
MQPNFASASRKKKESNGFFFLLKTATHTKFPESQVTKHWVDGSGDVTNVFTTARSRRHKGQHRHDCVVCKDAQVGGLRPSQQLTAHGWRRDGCRTQAVRPQQHKEMEEALTVCKRLLGTRQAGIPGALSPSQGAERETTQHGRTDAHGKKDWFLSGWLNLEETPSGLQGPAGRPRSRRSTSARGTGGGSALCWPSSSSNHHHSAGSVRAPIATGRHAHCALPVPCSHRRTRRNATANLPVVLCSFIRLQQQ